MKIPFALTVALTVGLALIGSCLVGGVFCLLVTATRGLPGSLGLVLMAILFLATVFGMMLAFVVSSRVAEFIVAGRPRPWVNVSACYEDGGAGFFAARKRYV